MNNPLSFYDLKISDATKHVHRLHSYKGKFIPQLVRYFLDDHLDHLKRKIYFQTGDIVLDPFSGSGTTLVQAVEMGIDAIGIDVSLFNGMLSQAKLARYHLDELTRDIERINYAFDFYREDEKIITFNKALSKKMHVFNQQYFFEAGTATVSVSKADLREKEALFLDTYYQLANEHGVNVIPSRACGFLGAWYSKPIQREIEFISHAIKTVKNKQNRQLLCIVLSRALRTVRATQHIDSASLTKPQFAPYYCRRHHKICKPANSIKVWFKPYLQDTLKRVIAFDKVRSPNAHFALLTGDARDIKLGAQLKKANKSLYKKMKQQKIRGIFSSPPYLGQINYHEQHAYAYDLFDIDRHDDLEIGSLSQGKGKQAKKDYIDGISQVLINCKPYLIEDADIFLVANDKHDLYPSIVEKAGMRIVERFEREVTNRAEPDNHFYSETIFHIKNKQ